MHQTSRALTAGLLLVVQPYGDSLSAANKCTVAAWSLQVSACRKAACM
jgi:hypothetical protein